MRAATDSPAGGLKKKKARGVGRMKRNDNSYGCEAARILEKAKNRQLVRRKRERWWTKKIEEVHAAVRGVELAM